MTAPVSLFASDPTWIARVPKPAPKAEEGARVEEGTETGIVGWMRRVSMRVRVRVDRALFFTFYSLYTHMADVLHISSVVVFIHIL